MLGPRNAVSQLATIKVYLDWPSWAYVRNRRLSEGFRYLAQICWTVATPGPRLAHLAQPRLVRAPQPERLGQGAQFSADLEPSSVSLYTTTQRCR